MAEPEQLPVSASDEAQTGRETLLSSLIVEWFNEHVQRVNQEREHLRRTVGSDPAHPDFQFALGSNTRAFEMLADLAGLLISQSHERNGDLEAFLQQTSDETKN